jgi:hypothetical protein
MMRHILRQSQRPVGARRSGFEDLPSPPDLEKFFFLDAFDRDVIAKSRQDSYRLGVAVQTGTEMARALQRVDDLARFRLGRVRIDKVPVRRMKTLVKYGADSRAPLLTRLHEPKKPATTPWSGWSPRRTATPACRRGSSARSARARR